MPAVPLPQAMIVCDNVHRDQSSGKYFLLGTFSTIVAAQVPCQHPAMFLFWDYKPLSHDWTRLSLHIYFVGDAAHDDTFSAIRNERAAYYSDLNAEDDEVSSTASPVQAICVVGSIVIVGRLMTVTSALALVSEPQLLVTMHV